MNRASRGGVLDVDDSAHRKGDGIIAVHTKR
jgi:hypothetical protein